MKHNMSQTDRLVRIIIAAGIAVIIYLNFLNGVAAIILGTLAVIFLITSAIGFCPLYSLFGFSTKKK